NIAAKLGSKEAIEGLSFETILANINRNILLDQLDTYAACLPNGGELYLSGFYDGADLEILKQKAESVGFQYVENKVLDSWCAAKVTKANQMRIHFIAIGGSIMHNLAINLAEQGHQV